MNPIARRWRTAAGAVLIALGMGCGMEPVQVDVPSFVDITWMSMANVHYQIGDAGVVTDGYFTRIPVSDFHGGGGGLGQTVRPHLPDVDAVARVLGALGGATRINLLLTGHSHFDHSFDIATWSRLTGAPIYGSRTTCFQAVAGNVPEDRCTPVLGGEQITVAPNVTMYVVRWNHSGDPATNPEQHNPVELDAVPVPDPETGGLRAGVAEDFPNGGGSRAYLFRVDGPQGRFSWFYQNTASAVDLPLGAGQISIHDGTLIHGSLPNCSERRRCGLTLRYIPTWVRQAEENSVASLGGRWKPVLVRGTDAEQNFGARARPW